ADHGPARRRAPRDVRPRRPRISWPAMKDSPGSLGSLRQSNRLRILDVLRREGSASRVDLVRDPGLSRPTVSKLVAELQAEGLIVERETTEADGGAHAVG